ncbi:MFS transporter [Pseudolabrys sp. Root1462]|uniref:MFS transporter n=1 Tax=Pseudolabrys sp. Root1462 TaxID=1736466 RepID=UPI0007033B66|nr:MFS transporter [Pseudolabrys sp. Root1462]KQZ00837.1 MFS transporter [Pseudolabrys sp. Root1462]
MSAVAEALPHLTDDNLARRNARVLAVAQALAGGNNTVIVSTASIVGATLAPDKGLATLPITGMVLGMWIGSLPLGWLARRYGRRNALQVGSLFGVLSGLVSCYAVIQGSFAILVLGTFFGGLYAAAHVSYRFAAADTASERMRAKVVSWVLAGGVFAAVIGPQLVIFTKDLLPPYVFAASYLGQSACAVIAAVVLSFVRIPRVAQAHSTTSRALGEIVRMPRFIVAVACGVVSYGVMNLVMTSAPLAMIGCGHSVTDAALGIQWHVLAMYAPSFVTGTLISRFGVERITGLGLVITLLSAAIGVAGLTVAHFWTTLVLLGIGWNFTFIGATTMVTQCHRPEERTKVQSFNDFMIFGCMALTSFSSGQFLALFGWAAINELAMPILAAPAVLLIWLVLRQRTEAAAAV